MEMDETQSIKSEAAAVRRRRSSILKSQRAARTPFSELEFNVATPIDTAKSRRVSFSKRTGVAEFATNEATTTWKNFYEEQNKSIETSPANGQSVGHLGRRTYFDNQFQDDEALAVDTQNPRESNNIIFDSTNFADQIASLENTGDGKNLSAPHNQFNLSSFTEHQTKIFSDNLGNSGFVEVTDKIDLNFSINPIKINEKYDLEEIQRDIQLQQASSNVICHGPIRDRKSVSEYIEIDELNMTRATANVDELDMSITDSIHSPKVQNVSINTSSKNASVPGKIASNNWVADKENIVVNPYIAPRESANFAINEESDQVLVYDGKRLTLQSQCQPLLSVSELEVIEKKAPLRKKLVLNFHDDLPNFLDDLSISRQLANKFEKSDSKIDMSNISFTQPLPAKVMIPEENKRNTIIFDDGDISLTQDIHTNVVLAEEQKNKRRSIVIDEIAGDISMTQALPLNILENKENKRMTILFDDEEMGNISVTQVVPTNIMIDHANSTDEKQDVKIAGKRKTIVFDDNDISVTQAVPVNILEKKENKRMTIVFDDEEMGNISVTQVVPTNIMITHANSTDEKQDVKIPGKRKTIVFDDNDISVTQAVPVNILEKKENKRMTIVFDDEEMGNISVTQVVPTNIMIDHANNTDKKQDIKITGKRKTLVFEDNDISLTQAVPANILCNVSTKQNDVQADKNDELSKTQDVLDEINSIIDCKDNLITLENCTQDPGNHSSEITENNDMKNITKTEKTFNISKCDEVRKSMNSFNQEVQVYQAFFKFGKRHKKKTPVPHIDDSGSQTLEAFCPTSDTKPASEASNTKTVLNELLNMSNATIDINIEKNIIPLKNEASKQSVTHEDSIGISQFQMDVALEGKSESKVNESDQSEFHIDMPLENKETNLTTAIELDYKPTDKNVEENDQAEIKLDYKPTDKNFEENDQAEIKSTVDNEILESPATVAEENDLEKQQLTLKYKSNYELENNLDNYNHVESVREKSLTDDQLGLEPEKMIENDRKMDLESEKLIEKDNILDNKTDISLIQIESAETQVELKQDSFINKNMAEFDPETTFAPSRKLSKIPSRQSLAPSRDEFLSDITMAQQMLQTTKFDLEHTSSMEDATVECTLDDDEEDANPKTESPFVVKKLHFEDETFSDTSEQNISALKKVTYQEGSEVLDNKAIVIPRFLKEVSEDVKDLMRDLVKPMTETMPFETNTELLKRTSTCSMQIQASLITSSQIEVISNESFNTQEATSTGRMKSVSFANPYETNLKSQINDNVPTTTIVFDPGNPLNNVLLTPIGLSEAHSYNPLKSNENLIEKQESHENTLKSDEKSRAIVDNLLLVSNPLNPKSKLKNSEINTTITVKDDKDLLRLHSSLTLMQDEDSNSAHFDVNYDSSGSGISVAPHRNHHANIIETDSSQTIDAKGIYTSASSLTETDSNNSIISVAPSRVKKRNYSSTQKTLKSESTSSKVELTPRPSSKMMRRSTSPTITLVDGSLTSVEFDLEFEGVWANDSNNRNEYPYTAHSFRKDKGKHVKKRIYSPQKHDVNTVHHETTPKPSSKIHKFANSQSEPKTSESKQEGSPKKLSPNLKVSPVSKIGTKVTVQRALVSYDEAKKTKIPSPMKKIGLNKTDMYSRSQSIAQTILQSTTIVAKIERFPFFGDGQCKWDACTRNAWVFSLLKGRVKFCVNFARTRHHLVKDDTPVDSVTIHVNRNDTSSQIALLCVNLAADTMRAVVTTKKECTAVRVPQLLGRCAGVARIATQWARTMIEARTRLGFALTADGKLTFHVANLTLRSVYHLTIDIKLVDTDAVPWPRASDVTVATLVGDDVTEEEIQRVVAASPRGWGHVPVTVWTLFRHLKNKVKQNQLLSLV